MRIAHVPAGGYVQRLGADKIIHTIVVHVP